MKRALSLLFPSLALLGCGRISSRIANFLLSITFGTLVISGGILSFTPLVEVSGRKFFALAGLFWLAAHFHARSLLKHHSFETLFKEEQAQLMQQTELMKVAAARRNSARKPPQGTDGGPQEPPTTQ